MPYKSVRFSLSVSLSVNTLVHEFAFGSAFHPQHNHKVIGKSVVLSSVVDHVIIKVSSATTDAIILEAEFFLSVQ